MEISSTGYIVKFYKKIYLLFKNSVPETIAFQRSHLKTHYNCGLMNFTTFSAATEYDRGLLDAREVGYIY